MFSFMSRKNWNQVTLLIKLISEWKILQISYAISSSIFSLIICNYDFTPSPGGT